jgi:predicted PurR-regulated permease PerM
MTIDFRHDLARVTLAVLCILLLTAGSLWFLLPFLGAIIWSTMIVVTTWPLLLKVQAGLGGRRGLAAAFMTLVMLLLFVIPLLLAVGVIAANASSIGDWVKAALASGLPAAPSWLEGLPTVGTRLAARWNEFVAMDTAVRSQKIEPYAAPAAQWVAGKLGGLGGAIVQFLLTVIISAVMYVNGEAAARGVLRLGSRLAGERGEKAVRLGGQAIRGVALGVFVTATLQTILSGLGLAVSGVPVPGLLTAVIFMLCLAQIGPIPVLIAAVIWMYSTGQTTWATALLVWTLIIGPMDNFLRPVLIKKGADLPLLLIFVGVIGGLLALGLIGVFVGPVFLAVTYTVLKDWVDDEPPKQEHAAV